jgi:branched-chain amino acid transport system permease protein
VRQRRLLRSRLLVIFLMMMSIAVMVSMLKKDYLLHIIIMMGFNAILGMSLRMILRSGVINIGHAAFAAIGGYTGAILMLKFSINFWLSLILVALATGIIGAMIGYATLRTKGIYWAILSVCMVVIVRVTAINIPFLGGGGGLVDIPQPRLGPYEVQSKVSWIYFTLLFLMLTWAFMERFERSELGRTSECIRQNEKLAWAVGVNCLQWQVIVLAIGSAFAGVAGCALSSYFRTICPETFGLWASIMYFLYPVLGGMSSVYGPMVGACLVVGIPEALRPLGAAWAQVVFACIVIGLIYMLPSGLLSLPNLVVAKISNKGG